jgi:hypothetical protein
MFYINKLYGVLTDGCQEGRKTNLSRANLPAYISDIVNVLVPKELPTADKMFRAEFLIKMVFTDIDCLNTLKDNDPYNTYDIIDYKYTVAAWDMQDVGEKIKQLALEGSERSFGYIEHILNALHIIINYLGK